MREPDATNPGRYLGIILPLALLFWGVVAGFAFGAEPVVPFEFTIWDFLALHAPGLTGVLCGGVVAWAAAEIATRGH